MTMTAVRDSSLSYTKLRDSCHSCATSKIKCPKEKPSCSKCKARGIDCQYYFAKRPGRRRESTPGRPNSPTSKDINNDKTNQKPSSSSIFSSKHKTDTRSQSDRPRDGDTIEMLGLSSQADYATNSIASPSSNLPNSLPESNGNSFLGTPPNLMISTSSMSDSLIGSYSADFFSVVGVSEMYPQLTDFDSNINNMDCVLKDSFFEHTIMGNDSVAQTSNDIGSLLIPNETINYDTDLSDASDIMSVSFTVPSEMSSLGSGFQTPSTVQSSGSRAPAATRNHLSCVCVAQGLDLLKTLSSVQYYSVSPFTGTDLALPDDMGLDLTVLTENKKSIEAVSIMLSCPSCTHDPFMLTILSMIVLKILERYSNVAKERIYGSIVGSSGPDGGPRLANVMILESKEHGRALSRGYSMTPCDNSAHGRAPAQLVLSELYRVQRLVNRLSPRLKRSREGSHDRVSSMEFEFPARSKLEEEDDNTAATIPFSSNTLAQMECDLRKNLSSLAAGIISRLRQS